MVSLTGACVHWFSFTTYVPQFFCSCIFSFCWRTSVMTEALLFCFREYVLFPRRSCSRSLDGIRCAPSIFIHGKNESTQHLRSSVLTTRLNGLMWDVGARRQRQTAGRELGGWGRWEGRWWEHLVERFTCCYLPSKRNSYWCNWW